MSSQAGSHIRRLSAAYTEFPFNILLSTRPQCLLFIVPPNVARVLLRAIECIERCAIVTCDIDDRRSLVIFSNYEEDYRSIENLVSIAVRRSHSGRSSPDSDAPHTPPTHNHLRNPTQSLGRRKGFIPVIPRMAIVALFLISMLIISVAGGIVDASVIEYQSGFSNENVRHAYVRQRHAGIPFANAVANVAFKENKIVSFGSSFFQPKTIAPPKPTIDLQAVIPDIEKLLEGKYNGHPSSLAYLARPDESASLVHVVQIENEETGTWYQAYVDAHDGQLLSAVDFVAHASYRVLPIQKQDLREGFEVVLDPQDPTASPRGWHYFGTTNTTNTSGNNVVAYKTAETGTTAQSATGLIFNYTQNPSQGPTVASNLNAARTNAFYIMNRIHDFAYHYGFTEAAFNFQADNFGKGGAGGDRVLVSVQDNAGTNNANFATPPDGQSGKARMYLWNPVSPSRDGALANDILVHEMAHGITNRLTGGGSADCLLYFEAQGLGEGCWTEQKSAVIKDWAIGGYVTNSTGGLRSKPYSTNSTTNPLRYSSAGDYWDVHDIGEVWANMLHNVYAALVTKYGWSATAMTDATGPEGNIVYMHLFIDALSLQPCNPDFVQARDAWIQADVNRYKGANRCLLWKAFASRGLGLSAQDLNDNFAVPEECS
ncbi:Fungalysin metallopeptidase-domain-containing protein [Ephemerocybe angulata]|uniref:Extracellular metalloproteinase n=1 Tax=Ephemerocybe angulata TaxID=980116 RepID=A0A8H6I3Y0_9AGAR|nr:Fungalysin metallopeptidase-domain-containing protein [Tulosesus angulatus]